MVHGGAADEAHLDAGAKGGPLPQHDRSAEVVLADHGSLLPRFDDQHAFPLADPKASANLGRDGETRP